MLKEEVVELLRKILEIDPPELKEAIISRVADRGYEPDLQDWEQLRGIKREMDAIWIAVKKCSERQIVSERIARLLASFPRPTIKPK